MINVNKGKALIVYGPASVKVLSGELLASGVSVDANSGNIVIRGGRGITFYALSDSVVEVSVGSSGSYSLREANQELVLNWLKLIDEIVSTRPRRVMIIGAPDTGKSTFSLWLFNNFEDGCFIEADIGQNELGLPGFVAIACSKSSLPKPLVLQDIEADASWFVGSVSVDSAMSEHIIATSMASRYAGNRTAVVDTDGYIEGKGLLHKINLANLIEVDTIVVMGDKPRVEGLKRILGGVDIYAAKTPSNVRERDRADRRAFRERAYSNLFMNSRVVSLNLDNIDILNMCIVDNVVRQGNVLTMLCDGRLVKLVQNIKRPKREAKTIVLPTNWAKGIYSALRLRDDTDIPCIVESIDFERRTVKLKVPERYSSKISESKALILGCIYLTSDYKEAAKYKECYYPFTLISPR